MFLRRKKGKNTKFTEVWLRLKRKLTGEVHLLRLKESPQQWPSRERLLLYWIIFWAVLGVDLAILVYGL